MIEGEFYLRCAAGLVSLTVLRLGLEMVVVRRISAFKLPGSVTIDWALILLSMLGLGSSLLGGMGGGWIYGLLLTTFGYRSAMSRHSRQAGDTMILVVLAGVSLGFLGDSTTVKICLWFIAAQVALAYFNNGFAKLRSPEWRAGTYLSELFSYSRFQNPILAQFLSPGKAGLIASWGVIGFEIIFPLALISGSPAVLVFLGFGILFHLIVAIAMGIGTFSLAFLAAYPAVYFCSVHFQPWLTSH